MNDETVALTKEEIGTAIINYIAIFKKGMLFFPFKIIGTDVRLHIPENVLFTLEYIPKGTKSVSHNI